MINSGRIGKVGQRHSRLFRLASRSVSRGSDSDNAEMSRKSGSLECRETSLADKLLAQEL